MKNLALHEALEAHELLVSKNLSITKAYTMSGLVQDSELKTILSNEVETGTKFIYRMKEFLDGGGNQNE